MFQSLSLFLIFIQGVLYVRCLSQCECYDNIIKTYFVWHFWNEIGKKNKQQFQQTSEKNQTNREKINPKMQKQKKTKKQNENKILNVSNPNTHSLCF